MRLAALALVAGLVGALAGCGVPGSSAPVVVGDAPKLGARQDADPSGPPGPDGARDGSDLVLRYFQAGAWANGTTAEDRARAMDTAASRVRAFFTPDARSQWQPLPQAGLTVVQVTVGQSKPEGGGKIQVSADWRPIGVLNERGWVEPTDQPPGALHTATFEIVQSDTSLRIAGGAPPGLLLSAEGLTELYEEHPIYYWDQSDLELIPDVRYMPKSVLLDRRPTVLVNWLLAGPSRWLASTVQPVPEGVEVNGNVAQADQRPDSPLVVNLSTKAAGLQKSLPHLVSQLRWSLRPFAGAVQLQIEQHQQSGIDGSSSAYLTDNPAVHQGSAAEPDRYCVVGGQVVLSSDSRAASPALPVLKNPVDSGVVSVGMKGAELAALVRQVAGGKQQLWLPDRADPARSRYVGAPFVARSITTPVWVSWPNLGVLVSADGELLYVPASAPTPVDITPPGFEGKISAVAIASDSHRLGLVAGGQVYVTTVNTSPGPGNNNINLAAPRMLFTGLTDPVGVAWSRESRLVVAGRSGAASTLVEISPDGVSITTLPLTNLANLVMTRIAGYPRSPTSGGGLIGLDGLLMIEAGGRSWKVFAGQVEDMPPKDRPASTACTAPFFVD